MTRQRRHGQLSERQTLILALSLVILVAISLLYCLGLASLALRQAWSHTILPWNETNPAEGGIDMTPVLLPAETLLPATASP